MTDEFDFSKAVILTAKKKPAFPSRVVKVVLSTREIEGLVEENAHLINDLADEHVAGQEMAAIIFKSGGEFRDVKSIVLLLKETIRSMVKLMEEDNHEIALLMNDIYDLNLDDPDD